MCPDPVVPEGADSEGCTTCDGDGYIDIVDYESGAVLGPAPCPDCVLGERES